MIGKLDFVHRLVSGHHIFQISGPKLVFPFQQGKKNFFLCLKIIIDGSPGETGCIADLFDGDLLEAHGLIELLAGVDNFFFSSIGQLRRPLWHWFTPH